MWVSLGTITPVSWSIPYLPFPYSFAGKYAAYIFLLLSSEITALERRVRVTQRNKTKKFHISHHQELRGQKELEKLKEKLDMQSVFSFAFCFSSKQAHSVSSKISPIKKYSAQLDL